ncbi:MAG: hypothetical protein HY058_06595 [Proteobacteria bacterium]|nr:hypothetical protein [Pseudomonadota bacterium]
MPGLMTRLLRRIARVAGGRCATGLRGAEGAEPQQRDADIEERNRASGEAAADLEAFTFALSHDLRAPLRSMTGFAEILIDEHGAKLDAGAHALLDAIRANGIRMTRLIDDMVMLNRLGRGRMETRSVDLSAVAQEIIDGLRQQVPERHVDLSIQPGAIEPSEPRLIRIVLEHLLSNAWKFTSKKEKATIEFGFVREGNRTIYHVRDNGAGFDMSYVGKLFKPFQRLHSADEFEGNGIGLAMVARSLRKLGGRAWANSVIDRETTVFFSLTPGSRDDAAGVAAALGSGNE